jgi:hypothetical protein
MSEQLADHFTHPIEMDACIVESVVKTSYGLGAVFRRVDEKVCPK